MEKDAIRSYNSKIKQLEKKHGLVLIFEILRYIEEQF